MSRAKRINPIANNILEPKLEIIEQIKGETLQEIAQFLRKRGIHFGIITEYLRNPVNYPGNSQAIKLIVEKYLIDTISNYYFQIQQEKLPINYVIKTIMKMIFRGKK